MNIIGLVENKVFKNKWMLIIYSKIDFNLKTNSTQRNRFPRLSSYYKRFKSAYFNETFRETQCSQKYFVYEAAAIVPFIKLT